MGSRPYWNEHGERPIAVQGKSDPFVKHSDALRFSATPIEYADLIALVWDDRAKMAEMDDITPLVQMASFRTKGSPAAGPEEP